MRIQLVAATALVSLAAASVAFAALPKNKALAIMHDRHEGMEKIGDTNKLLRREITSSSPFMPAIQSGAATIAGLSVRANGWFPKGTGPELGKTGAKPQIWQKPQDFAAKLRGFQAAAQAFNAAARSGDMAAIKARYADLGGSCKACHDSYRAEMHH
ncbi:MAG TPA: cytochrome c [Sphingomicrobium sp.]|nr:cytochrome c [Sphingomicrobium sp.]